ncbi:hypothetical protein ACOTXC_18335, partial [Enterobacter cloacae complex sp. IR5428]|uniref:hypothetical protein n=1 Tax=Enterobacter cloacae complex sp. IR5428 TaxID=3412365 RepID=UPI003BA6DD19
NVDHFCLAIRFAGWRLRLTRPTGAVFVLPGGGFALPGLRVRCSFCQVAASPYPAYGCGVLFAGWWLRLTRPTGAVFVLTGGGFALPGLQVRCS